MEKIKFKKTFRGYDPQQVDKYIADSADKDATIRRSQKERIDELLEENYNLRDRIAELQLKQNDIADALVSAQAVAREMEQNAKDYADKALFEAKKFYATWQAYSKTIVASFTEDELKAFLNLEKKIGDVIQAYENKLKTGNAETKSAKGEDVSAESTSNDLLNGQSARKKTPEEFVKEMEQAAEMLNLAEKSLATTAGKSKPKNPISKVEAAAGQSIDLRELMRPEQSLEELCSDLGLINTDEQ